MGTIGNPEVFSFTPGMMGNPRPKDAPVPPSFRCLVLGRAEDYTLKGLDIATQAYGRAASLLNGSSPVKLIVRGAPLGTAEALRLRLLIEPGAKHLDVVVRNYSANPAVITSDIREASLIMMPSRKEGFGLVGLEGISCGIPTLIGSTSGLARMIRKIAPDLADEWILRPHEDHLDEWASRIEQIMKDPGLAFQRVEVLRTRLNDSIAWNTSCAELLGRFAQIKSDHPSKPRKQMDFPL